MSSPNHQQPAQDRFTPYNRKNTPYGRFNRQHTDQFRPIGFSSPYHNKNTPNVSSENRYYQPNRRNFNNRDGGGGFQPNSSGNWNRNRNQNYKSNINNQQYHNQHNSSASHRGGSNDDISNYFHPSMLEDPWKQLLDSQQDEDDEKAEVLLSGVSDEKNETKPVNEDEEDDSNEIPDD